MGGATKDIFEVSWLMDYSNRSVCVNEQETKKGDTKRGCQHPSNKFEILWQFAQNSFSLLLLYFVAQYVLIIVV